MSKWARGELVDKETISLRIARLRTDSCYALTGFHYTKKDGEQDYKVIVTKADRAYWKALDDVEEALLGKPEKTDELGVFEEKEDG